MPAQTVNLDALIPREDFAYEAVVTSGGQPRLGIAVPELDGGFFANCLRKPDFQRETTHWTPRKVVDLIRAFLDGDLIPAVILWQRGNEIFVIDGAHRLSALIAWVTDDYGDGAASSALFGAGLTDEQRKIAKRTRDLIRREIGAYAEFKGLTQNSKDVAPEKKQFLSSLGRNSIIIQWVTANEPAAAEASFFKINMAAQPIDPTERRILQSRDSPNAIAARCIVRGGKGHKYWSEFDRDSQEEIEGLGADIYRALYQPPHQEPVATTDMPIAGKGYSALPFVFDMVNLANGQPIPKTKDTKKIENALPKDEDGSQTIEFLQKVWSDISLVSTNDTGSLGFHPLIYYYAMSGTFMPNAFLAALLFAKRLDERKLKKSFCTVRRKFEDYLLANKVFISLTVTRLGSGSRSLYRLRDLMWEIYSQMAEGKSEDEITENLFQHPDFAHLGQARIPPPRAGEAPSKKGASKSSKSAAFIRDSMAQVLRCAICDGALHTNSMSFDHVKRAKEGGSNFSKNLKPTHPFCNSGVKG